MRTTTGAYVQVKWRTVAEARSPVVPAPVRDDAAPRRGPAEPLLMMAVAKRLLPRAIDRNRFRRVVREAWRSCERDWPGDLPRPSSVFVRLMKRDVAWRQTPAGALKRGWRTEVDRLFAIVAGRRSSS